MTVAVVCIVGAMVGAFSQDWEAAKEFLPAYGTLLLAAEAIAPTVEATTVGRGVRIDRQHIWLESFGWSTIALGACLSAVVPLAALADSWRA